MDTVLDVLRALVRGDHLLRTAEGVEQALKVIDAADHPAAAAPEPEEESL